MKFLSYQKNFFKPTKFKIILTLILSLLVVLITFSSRGCESCISPNNCSVSYCIPGPHFIYGVAMLFFLIFGLPTAIFSHIIGSFVDRPFHPMNIPDSLLALLIFLIALLWNYFIVCIIYLICQNLKNKMKWKTFFKPTIAKIILFLIWMVVWNYIIISSTRIFDARMLVGKPLGFWPIGVNNMTINPSASIVKFSWINFIIDIIFWYVYSCVIIALYNFLVYFRSSKAKEVRNNIKEKLAWFKISKSRLIISILGWITISVVFINYLSGFYAGIEGNSPLFLLSIYNFVSSVYFLLYPFTIITLKILFPLTIIIYWIVVIFFAPISFESLLFSPTLRNYPWMLSTFGAVIIIPLLIIEWYLISCLIVYIFNKIRRK